MNKLPAIIAAVILGGFGILGALLVGISHEGTREQIVENKRQLLLQQLNTLVPRDQLDNDPLSDVTVVSAREALGSEQTTVYRARKQGQPVAVILSPVVARGYNGGIELIIGIYEDGRVAGVRVLNHRETPGLGDKIEIERSNWITAFDGRSIGNPEEKRWRVRRDGGDFDQFTGATITPRGVTDALRRTLVYFGVHRDTLFAPVQATDDNHEEHKEN